MTPVGPIAASPNTRWQLRLFEFSDTYRERRLPAGDGKAGPASDSNRIQTVPVEATRGRVIDLSV